MDIEKTEYEGMYVKLYDGRIGKIVNSYWRNFDIGKWHFSIENDYYEKMEYSYMDIFNYTEPSSNIINLIEVGDYVNGYKVIDIAQAPKKALYLNDISQKGALIPRTNKDIESIVTKEQFKSMEYKVGD